MSGRRVGAIGARLAAAILALALLGGCGATAGSRSPASLSGTQSAGASGISSPTNREGLPPPLDACASGLGAGTSWVRFEADGRDRQALLHVPATPPPASGYPAIVALAGYSTSAPDFERYTGLSGKADRSGFLVVYPEALGDPFEWHLVGGISWHPEFAASDHEFIAAVVDWLGASRCVDAGRIFLTGHSQGGGMTADLGCELGDRLAGIGLVSGVYIRLPCETSRPLALVAFHALDDDVLPYGGGLVAGAPADHPPVLPVENVMDEWALHDGCARDTVVSKVDGGDRIDWQGCAASVVFYRLSTGAHRWTAETADRLWTFFEAVPSSD